MKVNNKTAHGEDRQHRTMSGIKPPLVRGLPTRPLLLREDNNNYMNGQRKQKHMKLLAHEVISLS